MREGGDMGTCVYVQLIHFVIKQKLTKKNTDIKKKKKLWYIYTMEYYSAMKRNEIGSFVETWMDLETVIQSEVHQKEKNKYRSYINAYMWNLEKRYR